jgi:hypothetical protein
MGPLCCFFPSDLRRAASVSHKPCGMPVLMLPVMCIVTKFLGRWGRGTGSRYVVRYSREIFTLRVENEPGSRVEGGEPVLCDYGHVLFFSPLIEPVIFNHVSKQVHFCDLSRQPYG